MIRTALVFFLALAGCQTSGGDDLTATPEPAQEPEAMDPEPTPDPMPVGEPEPDPEPEPDLCDDLELDREPFKEGSGVDFGDVAGDFTASTLDGSFTLSENFLGCESFIFLNYIPDLRANQAGQWTGDALWNSDISGFLTVPPLNTHLFFSSDEPNALTRNTRISAMKGRFDEALAQMEDEEEREVRRAHLHFVTTRTSEITGSVGEHASDYMDYLFDDNNWVDLGERGQAPPPLPFAFAIGRDQKWDPVGNLNEVVGGAPLYIMAAYAGDFFNHRASVRQQVAQETQTEVVTLVDEMLTSRVFTKEITLPDADAMAGFDTLEFDIGITCRHRNPYACSEWDRIARIDLCLNEDCSDRREVVRWITPYWRRGERRWLIEASPMLGLLQDGGAQTFRIEMGPSWERGTEREAKMSLRLSTRGENPLPRGVSLAFRGGGYNADYNSNHPAFEFEVPEEATRVELVVLLSGHGQTGRYNCAEWCDHRHEFTIGGGIPIANLASDIAPGSLRGCAERTGAGVSPGQHGNWAPGRAYWCPGMPVQPMRFDMTSKVSKDRTNRLQYRSRINGSEEADGGNIDMSAYVVWYTD